MGQLGVQSEYLESPSRPRERERDRTVLVANVFDDDAVTKQKVTMPLTVFILLFIIGIFFYDDVHVEKMWLTNDNH